MGWGGVGYLGVGRVLLSRGRGGVLVLVLGVLRVSPVVSRLLGEGFALLPESELLLLCLPKVNSI